MKVSVDGRMMVWKKHMEKLSSVKELADSVRQEKELWIQCCIDVSSKRRSLY